MTAPLLKAWSGKNCTTTCNIINCSFQWYGVPYPCQRGRVHFRRLHTLSVAFFLRLFFFRFFLFSRLFFNSLITKMTYGRICSTHAKTYVHKQSNGQTNRLRNRLLSHSFLPLYALAMERSCRRLTSVCPSVCNVGEH